MLNPSFLVSLLVMDLLGSAGTERGREARQAKEDSPAQILRVGAHYRPQTPQLSLHSPASLA